MKILIADDDRVLNHLLTSRLSAKGCEIVTAFDAVQAYAAAMRFAPDVIVLDIRMPRGTGIEVLKKLKMSAKTAHIPVVVVSGSMDAVAATALVLSLGAVEFVPKPVGSELVYAAVLRAMETVGLCPTAQASTSHETDSLSTAVTAAGHAWRPAS